MAQEELDEVASTVREKEAALAYRTSDPESGGIRATTRGRWQRLVSAVCLQSFTLTFLAEWGDRSQITTIVLAAREVRARARARDVRRRR